MFIPILRFRALLLLTFLVGIGYFEQSAISAEAPQESSPKGTMVAYLMGLRSAEYKTVRRCFPEGKDLSAQLADAYSEKIVNLRILIAQINRLPLPGDLPTLLRPYSDEAITGLEAKLRESAIKEDGDHATIELPVSGRPPERVVLVKFPEEGWKLSLESTFMIDPKQMSETVLAGVLQSQKRQADVAKAFKNELDANSFASRESAFAALVDRLKSAYSMQLEPATKPILPLERSRPITEVIK